MKHRNRLICLRVVLFIFALVLFGNESGQSMEPSKIFAWVARQMNIAGAGALPAVYYVDKAKLQAVFFRANRRSYRRWKARFGTRKAKEFLNTYLEALVGVFDPDTKSIYIGRFLPKCRQQAVLAHEITHYFQVRTGGRVDPEADGADNMKLWQEMQADAIEQRYVEHFCKDANAKQPVPTTP
jgi:hypothetical protein